MRETLTETSALREREETTFEEVVRRIEEGTFYEDHDWASGPALRALRLIAQARLAVPAPTDQRFREEDVQERIAKAYSDGTAAGYADGRWFHDKAWMDAVCMLVHYSTFDARRTPEDTERNRLHWWDQCKKLAATRNADDIAALSSSVAITEGDKAGALVTVATGPCSHCGRPVGLRHDPSCYATPTQPAAEMGHQGLVEAAKEALEFISDEAENRSAAGSEMSDYEREPREIADRLRTAIAAHRGS